MILLSLFVVSFLAATLLPGGSEAALVAALAEGSTPWWQLLVAAALGNTLGGLVTMAMGRAASRVKSAEELAKTARQQRALKWLAKYGSWSLLLSWAPVIGDVLCLVAGWLRWDWTRATLSIAVGKAARYLVIIELTRRLAS